MERVTILRDGRTASVTEQEAWALQAAGVEFAYVARTAKGKLVTIPVN